MNRCANLTGAKKAALWNEINGGRWLGASRGEVRANLGPAPAFGSFKGSSRRVGVRWVGEEGTRRAALASAPGAAPPGLPSDCKQMLACKEFDAASTTVLY